jgi:short subunit dehydrogenase-like uncharacterized protein
MKNDERPTTKDERRRLVVGPSSFVAIYRGNLPMTTNTPYDIILWGATGFTGQLVAKYLAERPSGDEPPIRWAIAGRHRAKLEQLQRDLPGEPPILLADSHDRPSLDALVAQGRVIVSTVGPYMRHGEPLVAACVAAGRDYCDLTGETPWIRQMIDRYHEQAGQSGARIVHCCGFDSIPSDLGVLMLQERALADYGRPCATIYHAFGPFRTGLSGGTIASMLNLLEQGQQARRLLADPFVLAPELADQPRPRDQSGPRYIEPMAIWTAPFIMAAINGRIVYRSNVLLGFRYGRAFQYHEALRAGAGWQGRLKALNISAAMGVGMASLAISPLRRLLQATVLPKPGEGPSEEVREKGFFRSKLLGVIPAAEGRPAAVIQGRAGGEGDPAYKGTAQMLAETAVALAQDNRPNQPGGILTPAAALGMILVERLRASGMTFETTNDERPTTNDE